MIRCWMLGVRSWVLGLISKTQNPKPSRKGQFYIFVAVLLSVFALVITQTQLSPIKPVDTFKMIRENFEDESARVVNSAIFNQQNVSFRLANFSSAFIGYAKSRDPNFRFFYLLRYDGSVSAANYLGLQVNVSTNATSFLLGDGEHRIVGDNSEFNVAFSNYNYELLFGSEDTQLRAIFRSSSTGGVKVYVKNS